MSEKNGVDQKELKKLLKSLQKLPLNIQRNVVNGSTRAAAIVVKDEMKSRVPYETGTLEDALIVKKRRSKKTESKYSATVKKVVVQNGSKHWKNTAQYAYYLEYGTDYMPSSPFIRPSLTAVGNRPLLAAQSYFEPRFKKEKLKLGFK